MTLPSPIPEQPTPEQILAEALPFPLTDCQWKEIVRIIGISARQAQIAELILRDLNSREIATVLGITESTIETHKERICLQTGIRGRMQLAMRVIAALSEIGRQP